MASIPPAAFPQPPPPLCRRSSHGKEEEENNSILEYSNSGTTNIDSLPIELLYEILARLPPDSLYEGAMFVCPKWNKIIHTHSTHGLLLSASIPLSFPYSVQTFVTATKDRIEMNELGCAHLPNISVCCSKGLAIDLTSSDTSDALRVLSFSTKQSFPLPPLPVEKRTNILGLLRGGIAYSAASMEYKVIVPHGVERDNNNMNLLPRPLGFFILTVGVDKSWRHVNVGAIDKQVRKLLLELPVVTEGFFHWGKGRHCLTMDVKTEMITYIEAPLPSLPPPNCYYYLSTGEHMTVLIGSWKGCSWQVWKMRPETGEWRKAVSDFELEAHVERLGLGLGLGLGPGLMPFGWVKYPEVLAFHFHGIGVFYNLDTREISTVKLPGYFNVRGYRCYRAFPIRKSGMVKLS